MKNDLIGVLDHTGDVRSTVSFRNSFAYIEMVVLPF